MRRRTFTLASAVSLLLALAIIWPWSKSHDAGYRAFVARKNRWLLALESQEGRLRLAVIWKWPFDEPFRSEHTAYTDRMYFGSTTGSSFQGSFTDDAWFIEYYGHATAGTISAIQTSPTYFLPLQFIVFRYRGIFALLLILPTLWLLYWMARETYRDLHPKPRGRCPTCRYNLTGNTSGVCPECGTPITIPT